MSDAYRDVEEFFESVLGWSIAGVGTPGGNFPAQISVFCSLVKYI